MYALVHQVVHREVGLQALRELHVDSLTPHHLTLLTKPVKLFNFDFQAPQAQQTSTVEVQSGLGLAFV